MKKISVVIAAYNEEESLPMLYDRMKKLKRFGGNLMILLMFQLLFHPYAIFAAFL